VFALSAGGSGGSPPRASTDLPSYVTEVATGDWPRHIALDGETLYVANERSHEVMRMQIDPATGIPAHERTIEIPSRTLVLP